MSASFTTFARPAFTSLALVLAAGCAASVPDDAASTETSEQPLTVATLGFAQPSSVPMTGFANSDFKPVDDTIRRFMAERCVGGAVVGISYKGVVVHNRGYGYKNGPASPGCATTTDPFVGGEKIQPDTPFRIGSNSKAVLAAVFRIELKKALAKLGKPAADKDVTDLKLLDNGIIELVSPEVRKAMLANHSGDITTQACAVVNPWTKVTIGHLISHYAGLPRTGEDVYEELSRIRSLSSTSKLSAQEAASGAPAAARTALKNAQGNSAYFVPNNTLEEYVFAQGNRCFVSEPGAKYEYSNSGFGILQYVLEHVTGKAYSATNGYPVTHNWSLLSDFTETELGFQSGIQLSHAALNALDPGEPRYRHWDAKAATYYPMMDDEKRPWCVLEGATCNFEPWKKDKDRFNWFWKEQKVPFYAAGHAFSAGPGHLAAEAPKFLAFMKRFFVNAPYGYSRAAFSPASHVSHYGAFEGTASWVAQIKGGEPLKYVKLANNPDGTINFDKKKGDERSCTLPSGIDVFFAMNQRSDASCTKENGCVVCLDDKCKNIETAYSVQVEAIKESLCKSSWNLPIQ